MSTPAKARRDAVGGKSGSLKRTYLDADKEMPPMQQAPKMTPELLMLLRRNSTQA